jgi:hypothetical protein
MTDKEFEEIKARRAAACPGKWEGQGPTGVDEIKFNYTFDTDFNIYPPNTREELGYQVGGPLCVASSAETALFIIHASQDIPALIAEIERLREENESFCQKALETV